MRNSEETIDHQPRSTNITITIITTIPIIIIIIFAGIVIIIILIMGCRRCLIGGGSGGERCEGPDADVTIFGTGAAVVPEALVVAFVDRTGLDAHAAVNASDGLGRRFLVGIRDDASERHVIFRRNRLLKCKINNK